MQKITSKKLSNRLLQYGIMSAAALGAADVNGQIVYTDIDPDENVPVEGEFIVDITGGGTDFRFSNPLPAGGNAAIVFPSAAGAFVGITAYGFEYPALLAEGDVIDGAAGYTASGVRGDLNYYGCAYSNSQWCGNVVDGYLGITFVLSGNTHYGWVRLNTNVGGTNVMTIKDYAFNSVVGEAIAAGQTLSIEDNTIEGFSSFVSNNVLTLNSRTNMDAVTIHNISGQELISRKLSNTSEVIDLSALSNGVYIATVSIEGQSQAIKFVR